MNYENVELKQDILGSIIYSCKIPAFTQNGVGPCHGGALATYIDLATTFALYAFDGKDRVQVTATLDMSYYIPALVGDEVQIIAQVNKIGKQLAFLEGKIVKAKD
jgi:acyl-coenzyme A thioesterase 13